MTLDSIQFKHLLIHSLHLVLQCNDDDDDDDDDDDEIVLELFLNEIDDLPSIGSSSQTL